MDDFCEWQMGKVSQTYVFLIVLEGLIENGESGSYDVIFIDADKIRFAVEQVTPYSPFSGFQIAGLLCMVCGGVKIQFRNILRPSVMIP